MFIIFKKVFFDVHKGQGFYIKPIKIKIMFSNTIKRFLAMFNNIPLVSSFILLLSLKIFIESSCDQVKMAFLPSWPVSNTISIILEAPPYPVLLWSTQGLLYQVNQKMFSCKSERSEWWKPHLLGMLSNNIHSITKGDGLPSSRQS